MIFAAHHVDRVASAALLASWPLPFNVTRHVTITASTNADHIFAGNNPPQREQHCGIARSLFNVGLRHVVLRAFGDLCDYSLI